NSDAAAPLLFPMYTVPVEAVLQMTVNEPHEVLKAKGVAIEFKEGMGNAAFVSHQWVGDNHPDPEFKQLRVLQDALTHLLSGSQHVPLDMFTELYVPSTKRLRSLELRSSPLFIWFDYFSCPQLLGQGAVQPDDGDLSRATISLTASFCNQPDESDLSKAYVAKCRFFFALCPVVPQVSLGSVFTPMTWAARGWCRVERVCRELSKDHTWVIIKSGTEMELISSTVSFPGGSAGEGLFTVEEDRNKLAPVLQGVLMRKMKLLLRAEDLVAFRILHNMQSVHLRGFPAATMVRDLIPGFESDTLPEMDSPRQAVDRFLHQNGLANVHRPDRAGWCPLHYAALGGDPVLIRGLLQQRVDVNCWTRKEQPLVGAHTGMTALQICSFFKHHEAMRLLISARSDLICGVLAEEVVTAAAIANDPEGVRILCEARCDPSRRSRLNLCAFDSAAASGASAALEELLLQGKPILHKHDFSNTLHWATTFRGGSAEVVKRLLDCRADVNYVNISADILILKLIIAVKSLQHRFGRATVFTRWIYHLQKQTPLMAAILSGQYEGAAALIACGADLNLQNARRWRASDFAEEQSVPDFLKQAFQGEVEGCETVYRLAIANAYVEL
ncbi:unnamed protein product, partial [Symbiodinium pilosum]